MIMGLSNWINFEIQWGKQRNERAFKKIIEVVLWTHMKAIHKDSKKLLSAFLLSVGIN